ncbi:MAG: serine/threonine protein phosphatase [Oceanospirillaceae bacterium]|nr:serine/threonine protein phosphatase [Oceanospirillaceae bacterium]MBT12918.1 serine/threonine protein phosphatase [Oceanospirillaceae bacterium]|tara:strand:+ start:161626 stop:162498 length:873 start_codon:yes stop_codon:yes gene_type:complete
MSRTVNLAVNGRTDIGQVREENEDSVRWFSHPDIPFGYVVIADGMGGYTGGATASRIAVETLAMTFSQLISPTFLACTTEQQRLMIQAGLRQSIQTANQSIIAAKQDHPDLAHMGTTLVTAVVWQDQLLVAHVGDSRAYLWGLRGLVQLTRDHSVVQEMIDAGALSEEEARVSDVRNHITRALGVVDDVEPELNAYSLTDNGLLMLCSDGLTEYFDNAEIEHVLATHRPALECCYHFINEANQRGGKDNISVGMIDVNVSAAVRATESMQQPERDEEDITIRRNAPQREF